MARTKKVGVAGKFGARYGKKIRDSYVDIHKARKKKHICPECKKPGVTRIAAGVWKCRKCGLLFSGKAYKPPS